MKTRPAHAHLQNRILLLLLKDHEIPSLASLSRSLGVHRTSTSRSMRALKDSELVTWQAEKWILTAKGQEEALRLQQELPEQMNVATKRLVNLTELADLSRESLSPEFAKTTELHSSVVDSSARSLASMTSHLSSLTGAYSMVQSLNRPLTSAVAQADILASAEKSLDALMASVSPPIFSNLETARMISDATSSLLGAFSAEKAFEQLHDAAKRYDTLLSSQGKLARQLQGIESSLETFTREAWLGNVTGLVSATTGLEQMYSRSFKDALDSIASAALRPSAVEVIACGLADKMSNVQALVDLNQRLSHEAIATFSISQQLESAALSQLSAWRDVPNVWMSELGRVGASLGRAVEDLARVPAREFSLHSSGVEVTRSLADIVAVGRTHQALMADVIGGLDIALRYGKSDLHLAIPTDVSWALTSHIGRLVAQEKPDNATTDWKEERDGFVWNRRIAKVEEVLIKRAPHLLQKWWGSWEVLESDKSDCVSQSAHSGRELLMQYLAILAPDANFTSEEIRLYGHQGEKVTRSMRVRKALTGASNSSIAWADAVAKALDETYARLAAISHDRSPRPATNPLQVNALMLTLAGLIMFMDDARNERNNEQ